MMQFDSLKSIFVYLHSLPSAIGHLHDLRQLYAMKNSLTALPRVSDG